MQRTLLALSVVALCASSVALARDDRKGKPSAEAIAAVKSLDWLAGGWTGTFQGGRFDATYTTGDGGKLLSTSKSFQGDRVGFFEFEIFEARGDSVVLTPYPMGRPAESFKLAESGPRFAVFGNPEVEFPRTLRYERVADDRLVIVLEGTQGGKPARWTFDLRRAD